VIRSNLSPVWISTIILLSLVILLPQTAKPYTHHGAGRYNYGEVLQKSLYFYDAQRSGLLPDRGREPGFNRVAWRGDSALSDGADRGIDLSGGFFDAGDHVKFGFPMAASMTLLAWSGIVYEAAYQSSGQLDYLRNILKWGSDYILRAHPSDNELYAQVGEGDQDHQWWGPAEVMPMERPSFKIDPFCPGSDLAGESAAALAATSLIFDRDQPDYAETLREHAEKLYHFARTYRGRYSDCVTDAQDYYPSWNGYDDELVWAALWLYQATGDAAYLQDAQADYSTIAGRYSWTQTWDEKSYGAYILLAQLTGESKYRADVEHWLDYWTTGYNGQKIFYTPGGLAWLDGWGSLRYAANTAFLAGLYADWLEANFGSDERVSRYQAFAVDQINYMLGDNPGARSFVVGFGASPPQRPHHRTSHGSHLDSIDDPVDQRHILYGALVGGPDSADNYVDDRSDYQHNEVALDYNAGFTGALARLFSIYGGDPLESFPPSEGPDDDEIYVEAGLMNQSAGVTEVRAYIVNVSGWPARRLDDARLRYFFTLDPGADIDGISVSSPYTECAEATGPIPYDGDVYYVEVSCSGIPIFPGGWDVYRKEVQIRIEGGSSWDPANDWSYADLGEVGGEPQRSSTIALYEGDDFVWGTEPDGSSAPISSPAPSSSSWEEDGDDDGASGVDGAADDLPEESAPCTVDYALTDEWEGGFIASITFTHNFDQQMDGWTLSWSFPGDQVIESMWNGVPDQEDNLVRVTNLDYNALVSAGSAVTLGFEGRYSASNANPITFWLDGVACELKGGGGGASSSPSSSDDGTDAADAEEVEDPQDIPAPGCSLWSAE